MKKLIFILSGFFFFIGVHCQTDFKSYKAGHVFNILLPDYMSKTADLNSSASIQFKNTVKDIAGFVIFDSKEDLELAQMKYSSIDEFYEDFMKDFLKEQKSKSFGQKIKNEKNGIKFVETEANYFDKESKTNIYYFVGIVETTKAFYKVLCFGGEDAKEKYKADFEKIMLSIND